MTLPRAIPPRWRIALLALAMAAAAAMVAIAWRMPLDPARYAPTEASSEILDRHGRTMHAFLSEGEQWCFPRGLDGISPYLAQATIAVEDQRFQRHRGVDPLAIARAVWQNLTGGRVVSGASTITMQVVKLAEGDAVSLPGKLRQAWQALRLERRMDKAALLAAYLNRAPYGLNLIGAEAAARRYFGKPARELTLPEAALLAGLPKAPSRLMPLEHPDRALARRATVLRRMHDEGMISGTRLAEALAAPLGAAWHDFPQTAPHTAMRFRSEAKRLGALRTTLDAGLQESLRETAANALKRFDNDVSNAAIIVVEVPSRTVLAAIGSADFYSTPGGGQVDLCRAPRSPGSTLKPFVYALAMDRQMLYPSEMILDETLDLGAFFPANFSGDFHGLVPAADALRYSLNVPAVTVLGRLGPATLLDFLRDAGLSTLEKPARHYGLGLTLGNCEARLDELAAAYAMLANLGEYAPLRWLETDSPSTPKRLLSRGAACSIFEILEQPFPAEPAANLVRARGGQPRVCWKTGTSTGYRDAWTFAFNRQYLVGVWLGNNSGRASNLLVGARAALPLAAAVFRVLPATSGPAWPEPGGDLREVSVCAATGMPPSPWCAQQRTVKQPANLYLNRRCSVHRPSPNGVIEEWPGAARGWDLARAAEHMVVKGAASEAPARRNLRILNPVEGAEFLLTREATGDRVRLAASLAETSPLHWYLDGAYLGQSRPDTPLYLELSEGRHALSCMTPAGETDRVEFEVALPGGPAAFRPGV